MPKTLTNHDISILNILQQDSTASSTAIAEKLNMSQSPCWRRINKLEGEGLIKQKVTILDREKLGLDLVVFTTVNIKNLDKDQLAKFENFVSKLPEVMECYTMTGIWDYILKVVVTDIREYENFVREKLLSSKLVGELHSHISVTEIKNSTVLPIKSQLSK